MPKILLTGAAGGIGQATVERLLAAHHTLIVTDASLERLQIAFPHPHPNLHLTALDVTSYAAWQAVAQNHPDIDILIQLAGIMRAGWFVDQPIEVFEAQLRINLLGLAYGCKVYGEIFKARRQGHIINMASLGGVAAVPGIAGYSATKFGVRGLSLALAEELRPYDVHVTVICPGPVRTPLILDELPKPESVFTLSAGGLLGPIDVAKAIERAIRRRPLEITLPRSKSIAARMVSLFPPLQRWAARLLAPDAERRRQKYLQKIEKPPSAQPK